MSFRGGERGSAVLELSRLSCLSLLLYGALLLSNGALSMLGEHVLSDAFEVFSDIAAGADSSVLDNLRRSFMS